MNNIAYTLKKAVFALLTNRHIAILLTIAALHAAGLMFFKDDLSVITAVAEMIKF
jgi:hypothetical protein